MSRATKLKMGTVQRLASRPALLAVSLALICTQRVSAALYTPHSYFVTGSFSFDVINPGEMNNQTQGTASIPGLIGGRLQLERGLFTPSWTHWVELDYFSGSSEASGDAGAFSQGVSYWAILPVGLTYYFARTAFIDFGFSVGGGVGLAPSYTLETTVAGKTTTTDFKGKLGPVVAARFDARFWLSKYLAATGSVGAHVFSSTVTSTDGTNAIHGALSGLSIIAGVTYAFGGVQGNGRSYVEVIHDRPDRLRPSTKQILPGKQLPRKPIPAPTATGTP